ncbi:MAG: Ig-like domain-containing protein [Eubacterium sp.]|nr:Ig-like domain-containing protein [Eubacterium sp.]
MKKIMRIPMTAVLAFALIFGVGAVKPANAATLKGLVAPITIKASDGWGSTNISHWFGPDSYTTDFSAYSVSADVYIPKTAFANDGKPVHVNAEISFWFEDLDKSGLLPMLRENEIMVGYDKDNNNYWYNGWNESEQKDVELPFVKSVTAVDDMVKVEIVDAPVSSTLYTDEWDEATDFQKPWTDAIPEKNGHINASVRLGGETPFAGKFAVSNVSVKVGDKTLTVDYNSKENIGDAWGDVEQNIGELKATGFNTTALTVAKTSVSVKAKKSASIKVTTMFDGDKVTVSSSSKKIATATYKKGKVTIKGVKKGKATVTVKANGATKKIKVTVK